MSEYVLDVYDNEVYDWDDIYVWQGDSLCKGVVAWTYNGSIRLDGETTTIRNLGCIVLEKSIGVFKTKIIGGDSVMFRYHGHL